MKSIIAVFLLVIISPAFGQEPRALASLIAEGYEVKAMTYSGGFVVILQKGNQGWLCLTKGPALNNSLLGAVQCERIQ